MLQFSTRSLKQQEKSILEEDLTIARGQRQRWVLLCVVSIPIVLLIGTPLALRQAQQDAVLGYLAYGTMAIYLLVIAWVFLSNTREVRKRIRKNLRALERDEAFVIHCKANRVVKIEEEDDLPAIYFIQGDKNSILYCEMYQEDSDKDSFPSSDFKVSKVCDEKHNLLLLEVESQGDRLAPERALAGDSAKGLLKHMTLPNQNFTLMKGTLDRLEEACPLPPSAARSEESK